MKLRRALAAAAATAAIAPIALLSAPAAFATDPSPSATTSGPAAEESTPTADDSTPTADTSTPAAEESTPASDESTPAASASPSASASASSSTSTEPSDEPSETAEPSDEPTEPSGICQKDDASYISKLDAQLRGLPGRIAVGSGWHPFTLKVKNPTESTAKDVIFYAGVGPNDENAENAFKASQVQLQVKYDGIWVNVADEDGYSSGYLDLADIKGGQTIKYELRLNVKASAPIGKGMTIGGGIYFDEDANCLSADEAHYVIQIVKAGTDTDGTKPQEGGKVPVPSEKPNKTNTQAVTGSLAETGSSSGLPVIATVGGIAIVAGAGVVFAMKRRRSGAEA